MKFTSVAITGAVLGLANASPIVKRAITDGILPLSPVIFQKYSLLTMFDV